MVDFKALRSRETRTLPTNPIRIFELLPKNTNINDLYHSQARVLEDWDGRREERDIVVKLHTGGGKTLVGLLMGLSIQHETSKPVLYLCADKQLQEQTLERSREYGIPAVPYTPGEKNLPTDFVNADSLLIATYQALVNAQSKFGVEGTPRYQALGGIVMDDAHVAFPIVRNQFTFRIVRKTSSDLYEAIAGLFEDAFSESGLRGTYRDIMRELEDQPLEIPHWAWIRQLTQVHSFLEANPDKRQQALVWPLIRDRLNQCYAFVRPGSIDVTPYLPWMDSFPSFANCQRRIYMSATIADDTELVRTFGISQDSVKKPLTHRSLAGIGERMILAPQLIAKPAESARWLSDLLRSVSADNPYGILVLGPSKKSLSVFSDICTVPSSPGEVASEVGKLQRHEFDQPVALANRYNGIDLPGDACRILVIFGLPQGSSSYEQYRASVLHGGATAARDLAQRLEQGLGRASRGSSDYCVVILEGSDLSAWIAERENQRFLTPGTLAQLRMGQEISSGIQDLNELSVTVSQCLERDSEWIKYHRQTLAETILEKEDNLLPVDLANAERRAFRAWTLGKPEDAYQIIDKAVQATKEGSPADAGWLCRLAARIAMSSDQEEAAVEYDRAAFELNQLLGRPQGRAPRVAPVPAGRQAEAIGKTLLGLNPKRGSLARLATIENRLLQTGSFNQFEQGLKELGLFLGFTASRPEKETGEGPDVLWILPGNLGLVIEAKNQKTANKMFTLDDAGQLNTKGEWFRKNYPGWEHELVSVHPASTATADSFPDRIRLLSLKSLARLVTDARNVFETLSASLLTGEAFIEFCQMTLESSNLIHGALLDRYLSKFDVVKTR